MERLPSGIKFTHELKPTGTWNLLTESWIPVRFRDGRTGTVPVRQIVDPEIERIDFVLYELEWTTLQFLIGLVQTICLPRNKGEQIRFWTSPPSEEDLQGHLDRVAAGFFMNGDVRFYQTSMALQKKSKTDVVDNKEHDLSELLILRKTPNGRFYYRDASLVTPLNPGVVGMLLYLSSIYDPGTGGSITGVRGTDFVTTTIEGETLWQKVWRNVIPLSEIPGEPTPQMELGEVFEWLSKEVRSTNWVTHECPEKPIPMCLEEGERVVQFKNFFRSYWMFPNVFHIRWRDLSNLSWTDPYQQTKWIKRSKSEWTHPLTPYYLTKPSKKDSDNSKGDSEDSEDSEDMGGSGTKLVTIPVRGFLPYQRYKAIAKYNYLDTSVRTSLVLQKNLDLSKEVVCRVFGFGGFVFGRQFTNSFDFTTVVKGDAGQRLALFAINEKLLYIAAKIEDSFKILLSKTEKKRKGGLLVSIRTLFYVEVDPLYDRYMDRYVEDSQHTDPKELLPIYAKKWKQELIGIAKNIAHTAILDMVESKDFWNYWGLFQLAIDHADQPSKQKAKK